MAAYFEKKKNGLVGFTIGGKEVCHLIDFDYDSLPPQIFVAIEAAHRAGVEAGIAQKQAELRNLVGV